MKRKKDNPVRKAFESLLLPDSREVLLSAGKKPQITYDGNWPMIRGHARVFFITPREIRHLAKGPPIIYCNEPYIRRDIDWHCFSDGQLCYELGERWRDAMAWKGKSSDLILEDAVRWMRQSVTDLIARHQIGYRKGLQKWPEKWNEFGHGSLGVDEYEFKKTAGNQYE